MKPERKKKFEKEPSPFFRLIALSAVAKALTKLIEKFRSKHLRCRFCGEMLKEVPYGYSCEKCGYVILFDDVKEWLDKIFQGEVVDRDMILYKKAYKSGYEAGYEDGVKGLEKQI